MLTLWHYSLNAENHGLDPHLMSISLGAAEVKNICPFILAENIALRFLCFCCMPYKHCAWEQRLVCVSFLVTKVTQGYKSQTNNWWRRLHAVFILSCFAQFGRTHSSAGTNKTSASQLASFPRLYYRARLTHDGNQQSSIVLGGVSLGPQIWTQPSYASTTAGVSQSCFANYST